jgi:hypothetical protein
MPSSPSSAVAASTVVGSTSVQLPGNRTRVPLLLDAMYISRSRRDAYGLQVMSLPSCRRTSKTKNRTGTRRNNSVLGCRFCGHRRCRRLKQGTPSSKATISPSRIALRWRTAVGRAAVISGKVRVMSAPLRLSRVPHRRRLSPGPAGRRTWLPQRNGRSGPVDGPAWQAWDLSRG